MNPGFACKREYIAGGHRYAFLPEDVAFSSIPCRMVTLRRYIRSILKTRTVLRIDDTHYCSCNHLVSKPQLIKGSIDQGVFDDAIDHRIARVTLRAGAGKPINIHNTSCSTYSPLFLLLRLSETQISRALLKSSVTEIGGRTALSDWWE